MIRRLRPFMYLSVILISNAAADTRKCNENEKSHRNKFNESPVVVVGKFLNFSRNLKAAQPNTQNAVFYLETILKGQFLHEGDGRFVVPLHKGHNAMSRKIFCLSEQLLTIDARYVLFLNHERKNEDGNEILKWKSLFVAEKFNFNTENIMYDLEAPIYELTVDTTASPSSPVNKRAEISIGDPLYFRCKVQGEAHADPSISWHFNGDFIRPKMPDRRIETDNAALTSTLKIDRFEPTHRGQYECSAKRKDGIKTVAKMKVDIKAVSGNYTTLFDEDLCPESTYSDYCKHGGVCLIHKKTNAVSCKCTADFQGTHCEFVKSDKDTKAKFLQAESDKTVITIGCLIGLTLILSFIAFIVYIKHRSRKNSSEASNKKVNISPVYIPKLLRNGQLSFEEEKDEQFFLLPKYCAKCMQEMENDKLISSPSNTNMSPIVSVSNQNLDVGLRRCKNGSFQVVNNAKLLDPNCELCTKETRSTSVPGFFKVDDVDDPEERRKAKFVHVPTHGSKKNTRRQGTSGEELESPIAFQQRRSASTPCAIVKANRRFWSTDRDGESECESNISLTATPDASNVDRRNPKNLTNKSSVQSSSKTNSVVISLTDD